MTIVMSYQCVWVQVSNNWILRLFHINNTVLCDVMSCHVVWQIFTTEHPKCQYIPTNCIASHSRCYPTQLLLGETQISLCVMYTMRLYQLWENLKHFMICRSLRLEITDLNVTVVIQCWWSAFGKHLVQIPAGIVSILLSFSVQSFKSQSSPAGQNFLGI